MFSTFFKRGKKGRVFQQVAALLLLTLSFADIAIIDVFMPEFCEREGSIISVAKAVEAINNQNAQGRKQITNATDTKHRDSSSPSSFDEDCFCCCSHILPSPYFRFPALQIESQQVGSITSFLPTSPPLQLYRPPRIA